MCTERPCSELSVGSLYKEHLPEILQSWFVSHTIGSPTLYYLPKNTEIMSGVKRSKRDEDGKRTGAGEGSSALKEQLPPALHCVL